jgi:predicted transcriptional regulator
MAEEKAAPDAVRSKMEELASERRVLEARLQEAEAVAQQEGAREQQYAAVAAWCAEAREGLDELDRAGRQKLLRDAVDRVVMQGEKLEIVTSFAEARAVAMPGPEPQAAECDEMSSAAWRADRSSAGPRRESPHPS